MKAKLISFFLVIIIFTSCKKYDNDFLIQNIRNDYNSIYYIDNKILDIKNEFEEALLENKLKVEPWKSKFDENNKYANEIILILEKYKISKLENYNDTIFNTNDLDLLNKSNKIILENSEIDLLKNKIVEYQKYLIESFPENNGYYYSYKENFCAENLTNYENIISNNFSNLELFSVLSKIQLNIKISQYYLANYLFSQIDAGCFRFIKIEAYCIPKSKIITLGQNYESEIFIGHLDTTKKSVIVLKSDTFIATQGTYKFKTKVGKDTGIVKINSAFLFESPANGEIINYPFDIEFEVIK